MVSKFEKFVEGGYAKELEENGYPVKAELLRALVKDFRSGRMPEVFPQEEQVGSGLETAVIRDEQTQDLRDIREIRVKLVQVLSALKIAPGKPVSAFDYVKEINQKFGKHLGDGVRISDLILPPQYDLFISLKTGTFASLRLEGFEGSEKIDVDLKRSYNYTMRNVSDNGLATIEEVRSADRIEMIHNKRMGVTSTNFVKDAFARPQAGK